MVETIEREIMNLQKIVLYSSILFLLAHKVYATTDQSYFDEGNLLFKSGKYQEAFVVYTSIKNKGFSVLYNMGLASFLQEKKGTALLYWKCAQKKAGWNELTLLHDTLNFIKKNDELDYKEDWYERLAIFMEKYILTISVLFLQILLLFIILMLTFIWFKRYYLIYKMISLCFVVGWVFIGLTWLYKENNLQKIEGVITKKSVVVLSGPDDSFYGKSKLIESDIVVVLEQKGSYYQVKSKTMIGWINKNEIELVK